MLRVVGSVATARTFCGGPVGTEMYLYESMRVYELVYTYSTVLSPR